MPRTYSTAEIAAQNECPEERVRWMTSIGLLPPDEHGRFTFGAVLAVRMASAAARRWSGAPSFAQHHVGSRPTTGRTPTSGFVPVSLP